MRKPSPAQRSPQPAAQSVRYFNARLTDEREASNLWARMVAALDRPERERSNLTQVGIRAGLCEISTQIDHAGRLRFFAVRLLASNELVLMGNRQGLFPFEQQARRG